MLTYWRLLLTICSLLTGSSSTIRRSGPYTAILEKLDRCEDSGTDESIFPTRLTKVSRDKAVINDVFRLSPTMDENSTAKIEIQEWGNQGYRPRAFLFNFKTCDKIWKETNYFLKQIFGSAGANLTGCPILAGNYTTHNLDLDIRLPKIPVMTYNKYRMLISLFYGGRKVGCVRFYVETVPNDTT